MNEVDSKLMGIMESLVEIFGGDQVQDAFNATDWSQNRWSEFNDDMIRMLKQPLAVCRPNYKFGDFKATPENIQALINNTRDLDDDTP